MSQTTYLKLICHNETLSVCKIIDKKQTLSVHKNDITIFDSDLSTLKKDGQFEEASRQEFDEFFKKTALKVNNFTKI